MTLMPILTTKQGLSNKKTEKYWSEMTSDVIVNEPNTHLQNIHENMKKCTFLSSTHVSFFKTDHVFSTRSKTQQIKENQNSIV